MDKLGQWITLWWASPDVKRKYAFNSDTIHPDSGIFEPSRMKPVQILKPRLSWRRYRAITSCGVRFTFSLNYVIITS